MYKRKKITSQIIFVALIIILAVHMAPIIIVILNSLRSNPEVRSALFGIPTKINFDNYTYVFIKGNYHTSYLYNFIVGAGAVFLVEILISLASYGVVKLKAYKSGFFTGYFIASLSIPTFGILIPLFSIFNRIGLVNTLPGLILIFTATSIPFNFMFARSFFIGIPHEIEEAAKIDGANDIQTLQYVTFPLATPILTTVALVVFTNSWNNFMIPTIFLSDPKYRLVSLNFFLFKGEFQSDLAYIFVAAVYSILPILLLYMFLQKSFIEGMTKGGIKG